MREGRLADVEENRMRFAITDGGERQDDIGVYWDLCMVRRGRDSLVDQLLVHVDAWRFLSAS